jgi:hypothetical protein
MADAPPRLGQRLVPITAWVVAIAILIACAALFLKPDRKVALVQPYVAEATYAVETITRGGHPAVQSRQADGSVIAIACSTCHSTATQPANPTKAPSDFHQGLNLHHGSLACNSCHDASSQYDALRLANGMIVPYDQAMTLCAQCHGPQARDYAAGAHGGMNGYWDQSRGPRQRNACTVCHDPHSPAYPMVQPAPGPHDRFLEAPTKDEHHE